MTNDSCQIEIEIVEELVERIVCQSRIERRSLEPLKAQGPCGKAVIEREIMSIRIDLGETIVTVHDQETAIHIEQAEVTETDHDRDLQDEIGIGMIEIVGKGVLQGIWIVMRATSAEE